MIPTLTEGEAGQRGAATLDAEASASAETAPVTALKADEASRDRSSLTFYKDHSLAAGYWGELGPSGRPLRKVSAGEAQATFFARTPRYADRSSPPQDERHGRFGCDPLADSYGGDRDAAVLHPID